MRERLLDLLGSYGIDEFDTNKFNMQVDAFLVKESKIFTSEDIDVANDEILCILFKEGIENSDLKTKIEDLQSIQTKENLKDIYIFEVSDSPLSKGVNSPEEIKTVRKMIQQVLKNNFGKKISLNNITYDLFVVTEIPDEEKIVISIDSRINSLERENRITENLTLKGYVFSAKLEDVLKLYEVLGNTLFEKNLRYSIGEQLGVNSAIKDTIETNSDAFWFLNNGISLYVDDEDQLDFSIYDKIKLKVGKTKIVSVINGAQTITASARANFENSGAYVLLRIFVYSGNKSSEDTDLETDKINSELDKITVALNRQKPIKSEDVAYTYDFISEVNSIPRLEGDLYHFQFVRRGEIESNISHRYMLINFARLVKAYLEQKPGDARSKGANTLLKKVPSEEMKFADKSIFIDLPEDDSEELKNILLAKYKPVNFVFKLKSILNESYLKEVKDTVIKTKELEQPTMKENLNALANYGRYFLIAFIVRKKNNDNTEDFSDWIYSDIQIRSQADNVLTEDKLRNHVEEIFEFFTDFVESNKLVLDANSFKKEEIYTDFISFMEDKEIQHLL